jgi:hypothetical protein
MVLVYFALSGCVAGALFGIPVAYLLRLVRMPWRHWLYFCAVAGSLAPYVLHYQHSQQYLARSGVENYSGLEQYTFAVPMVTAVSILGALPVAWFRPALAALLPVVFGALYWFSLVPLLYQETPDSFVGLDNVPFVWLFALSVAGYVFLLLISALALGSRRRHSPVSDAERAATGKTRA